MACPACEHAMYARSARCPRHRNEARGATSCINCCVRGRPGDDAWCCSACLCRSAARPNPQLLRARAAGRRRVVRVSVQLARARILVPTPIPCMSPPGATCPVVCSQPQLFPEISEYYYLTHGMEATDREGRLPFNGSASAGVSARNVAPRRGECRARGVHVRSPASRGVPWRLWWVRRA